MRERIDKLSRSSFSVEIYEPGMYFAWPNIPSQINEHRNFNFERRAEWK